MEIVKYHNSYKKEWDVLIENSKNGLFLFHRDYLEYHKDRFIDHSLMVYKNNKVIAVLPANEKDKEVISHGGLTFGSLIMSFDMKAVEVIEAFDLILKYYQGLGFETLTYKSIPAIFHKYPSEEDLYALNLHEAILIRRDLSSVINLKNSIRFSESKRQAVTKCLKNEIVVIENQNYSEYWHLLTDVLAKFDTKPVHDLAEIKILNRLFPENIRLFEARTNEELLAGIVIYDYGITVHTQYMANSAAGRKLGALDFINHHLITEVFAERDYYSFGISTEKQGLYLNSGLIQQKEMMGGRGITIDFYSIDLKK